MCERAKIIHSGWRAGDADNVLFDSLKRSITQSPLSPSETSHSNSFSSIAKPFYLFAKTFKFQCYRDDKVLYAKSFILEAADGISSFKYVVFIHHCSLTSLYLELILLSLLKSGLAAVSSNECN